MGDDKAAAAGGDGAKMEAKRNQMMVRTDTPTHPHLLHVHHVFPFKT